MLSSAPSHEKGSLPLRHTASEVALLLKPAGTTELTSEPVLKLLWEPAERRLHVCYNGVF